MESFRSRPSQFRRRQVVRSRRGPEVKCALLRYSPSSQHRTFRVLEPLYLTTHKVFRYAQTQTQTQHAHEYVSFATALFAAS